jgi:hypothetical protein
MMWSESAGIGQLVADRRQIATSLHFGRALPSNLLSNAADDESSLQVITQHHLCGTAYRVCEATQATHSVKLVDQNKTSTR